jgi:hypothetical protein
MTIVGAEPVSGTAVAADANSTPLGAFTTLTATVTEGSGVNYIWGFGDGTGLSSGNPVGHTYAAAGCTRRR